MTRPVIRTAGPEGKITHALVHIPNIFHFTRPERLALWTLALAFGVGAGINLWQRIDSSQRLTTYEAGYTAMDAQVLAVANALENAGDTPFALDLNTASETELTVLPGIGPVKARAIIAYRDRHGPFVSVETLLEVHGIGPKTLAQIQPFLSIPPAQETGTPQGVETPASPVASAPASATDPPPTTRAATAPFDINTADAARFQSLNGIGPVLSQRIVDYRAAHGPFSSVEDLTAVRGIGPKTLARLRPFIRTGGKE